MLTINKEGNYDQKELDELKKLIGKIIKKYNIDKDNILREYDVNCSRRPVLFADEYIMLYDIIQKL